jgi:hypothetical protein
MVFVIVGQFFLPRSRQSIQVWMDPELLDDLGEVSLRLTGKEISLGFFKRWYEFEIEPHNLWLLAIIGLASLLAAAAAWTVRDLPIPGSPWYYAGSAWLLGCYLAWRWLWERRAMRQSGFALGSVHVISMAGPIMKRVVYHFRDHEGEYRGGIFRTFFCDTRDHLTVVVYNEDNPAVSVPASAMMFHRVKWLEARNADTR